ncbi:hypothetical protein DESUT3_03390 [Desulfuromonas versatilis]|uniref:C_GCAxxG_C_C family protein n=1 Tax=Desulfuromonas versatilis TaxID=2802975 RepID=A0ABN6DSZ2_9BACT|nr:C-GCAxxG-C-C family protein [Desulfuromonas versatilis]BCR03270.1 hypothetical protein DESUT3_03390 [Desulfuromonas versatilis]
MLKLLRKKSVLREDMNTGEKAGRLFDGGHNCAQAVFQAATGVDDPRMMAMTQPFRGGIGDSGCLCGAIAGGVMALGWLGKGWQAAGLVTGFREKHKGTCCHSLSRGFKWMSREHSANCRRLTVEAASLVEKLLR